MEETLLQKAKKFPRTKIKDTRKEGQILELGISALNSEISMGQAAKALQVKTTTQSIVSMFYAIRNHLRDNGLSFRMEKRR